MLLEFGADKEILNADGVSSFDIANMEDFKDIKMLFSR